MKNAQPWQLKAQELFRTTKQVSVPFLMYKLKISQAAAERLILKMQEVENGK